MWQAVLPKLCSEENGMLKTLQPICTGRDQFDDIVYMYMHSLDWDVATNEFDGVCSQFYNQVIFSVNYSITEEITCKHLEALRLVDFKLSEMAQVTGLFISMVTIVINSVELQVVFVGMMFGSSFWGWLADRYGRKTVSNATIMIILISI